MNIRLITTLVLNHVHSTLACLGHDVLRISKFASRQCIIAQASSFLDEPSTHLPNRALNLYGELALAHPLLERSVLLDDCVKDFDEELRSPSWVK